MRWWRDQQPPAPRRRVVEAKRQAAHPHWGRPTRTPQRLPRRLKARKPPALPRSVGREHRRLMPPRREKPRMRPVLPRQLITNRKQPPKPRMTTSQPIPCEPLKGLEEAGVAPPSEIRSVHLTRRRGVEGGRHVRRPRLRALYLSSHDVLVVRPARPAARLATRHQHPTHRSTPRSARLPANEIRELARTHSACAFHPKSVIPPCTSVGTFRNLGSTSHLCAHAAAVICSQVFDVRYSFHQHLCWPLAGAAD